MTAVVGAMQTPPVEAHQLGTLRLGTRRSALAMAQSEDVADALRAAGFDIELVTVTTLGDTSAAPLTQLGGTGVFVSALRQQLIAGEIDLAVHSLKDLPTAADPSVTVAAVPVRADARDALVSIDDRRLDDLPQGATVGTGSPRRAAALRRLRRDLEIVAVRGNVDTRLGLVGSTVDAVVLAAAGLARLGRSGEVSEFIDIDRMLPAPGQGALAVECRSADSALAAQLLAHLEDPVTRAAVTAERAVLAGLEAGCTAPVGAHAKVSDGQVVLTASVITTDGTQAVQLSRTAPVHGALQLGIDLAEELLAAGAAGLIGEIA